MGEKVTDFTPTFVPKVGKISKIGVTYIINTQSLSIGDSILSHAHILSIN